MPQTVLFPWIWKTEKYFSLKNLLMKKSTNAMLYILYLAIKTKKATTIYKNCTI